MSVEKHLLQYIHWNKIQYKEIHQVRENTNRGNNHINILNMIHTV